MPDHTKIVQYHMRRFKELKALRQPWEDIWSILAEFVEPTRLRLNTNSNRPISRGRIIDPTATQARKTMASGMHSDITSPARPWFKLTLSDEGLKDDPDVKKWCEDVGGIMRDTLQTSNIYSTLHTGYGDLALFGQPCILLVADEDDDVRGINLLHGTFWLARDDKGRATTLYRQFVWSAARIVKRWGIDNVPNVVRDAFNSNKLSSTFVVNHAVEPREDRSPHNPLKSNMPWTSNYWLDTGHGDAMLEISGFEENPILAPAWELAGDDHYSLSPAQEVLGAIRALQKENFWKLEALEKKVRPPMVAPTTLRNDEANLLPAGITYLDATAMNGAMMRPAFDVNIPVAELLEEINDTRAQIERAMFVDLFLMLSQMDGVQPRNQMEIIERKAEKMLALGPVLENIHNGLLEPLIERVFGILLRKGKLPPPPEKLSGVDIKVEYISVLSQAQKANGTGSIERLLSLTGNLSAVAPDVLDRIDTDAALVEYADLIGVNPKLIRSDDAVAEIREGRAAAAAQAQQAEQMAQVAPAMNQGAQAAALLAETAENNPTGGALLSRLALQ